MKTELMIVTYWRDIPYLEWCLKSVAKFATGFSGVTVVVPRREYDGFKDLFEHHLPPGLAVELFFYDRTENTAAWHLDAQCQKCLADVWCPDADLIAHIDSDCVFTEPVTPEDYFVNGKPVMLYQSYASLPPVPWKAVTEAVLGFPVQHEFMRRHPQVNPRAVYQGLRQHVEIAHGKAPPGIKFRDFVISRKADYPWGFSEHNAIGAYAWQYTGFHDQYHWIDTEKNAKPHDKIFQAWSNRPPHLYQEFPSGGAGVPLEIYKQLGL